MTFVPVALPFVAKTGGFVSAVGAATKAIGGFSGAVRLGTGALAGFSGAQGLQGATTAFFDFERSLIKTNTLVGLNIDLVREWGDELVSISSSVGVVPAQLAEGLFGVTSGGLRSVEALELVEQAAKASALGLGSMFDITRTATAAVQSFGKTGLTASNAVDVLVGIVREGSITADTLSTAMGRVLGIGATVGATFQDLGTFLAAFTRLGVSAEEAATSLRSTLTRIVKPSDDSRKAFEELGIPIEDFRVMIQEKGLTQSMLELVAAVDAAPDKVARLFPNVRALTGILGNYAVQAEEVVKIQEEINGIIGTTNTAFEEYRRTGAGALDAVEAATSRFKVTAGSAFSSASAAGLIIYANALDSMSESIESVADIIDEKSRAIIDFFGLLEDLPGPTAADQIGNILGSLNSEQINRQLIQSRLIIRESVAEQERLNVLLAEAEASSGTTGVAGQRQIARFQADIAAQEELQQAEQDRIDLIDAAVAGRRNEADALERVREQARQAKLEAEREAAAELRKKQLKEINSVIEALERRKNTLTLTRREIALEAAETNNATDAQLERIDTLGKEIEVLEERKKRQEEWNALLKRSTQFVEQFNERRRAEADRVENRIIDEASRRELARFTVDLEQTQRTIEDVSRAVGDAAVAIFTGTENIGDAFGNMVDSILQELARLSAQEFIIGPLFELLRTSFLDSRIAGLRSGLPSIPDLSGVDLGFGSSVSSASVIATPSPSQFTTSAADSASTLQSNPRSAQSQQERVVVSVPITFAPNFIDGTDGARWLRSQAPVIQNVIAEGAQKSVAFRRAIRGR